MNIFISKPNSNSQIGQNRISQYWQISLYLLTALPVVRFIAPHHTLVRTHTQRFCCMPVGSVWSSGNMFLQLILELGSLEHMESSAGSIFVILRSVYLLEVTSLKAW